MAFYQVKRGVHILNDGTQIGKGEVFESTAPLIKRFPNRFRKVPGPEVIDEDRDDDEDEPKKSKAGKKSSKLSQKLKDKKKGKKSKGFDIKKNIEKKSKIGKDVTSKFRKEAGSKLLKVFRTDDGKYNVATEKDPRSSLNATPLNRLKLGKFLSQYSPPDSEEDDE